MKLSDYLRQFPIYWINMDAHVERRAHMKRLFASLGVSATRVSAEVGPTAIQGCGRTYLKLLEGFFGGPLF